MSTLLALDRPVEALAVLRSHPRSGAEPYLETARRLSAMGWRVEASEMFNEALRRDLCDSDLVEAFARHDAEALLFSLETLERCGRVTELEQEDVTAYRARALQALGQDEAAAALLPDVASYYRKGSGCTPTHLGGEPWELEAWSAVDPQGVREVLVRVLEDSGTSQEDALLRLAAVCERLGDPETFEREFERFREQHGLSSEQLVELAPYIGWEPLADYCSEAPVNEAPALALAAHHLQQGRTTAGVEVLEACMRACWTEGEGIDEPIDFARLAPERVLPLIEHRIGDLAAGVTGIEDPSWELANLAEMYWDLGRPARAAELWRLADRLDPEGPGTWIEDLHLHELGVLE